MKSENKLILVFLVFMFLISATFTMAQDQAASYKGVAESHMNAGRYGEAIALWNKYITLAPRDFYGYQQRAICYENRGQYPHANHNIKMAVKLAKGEEKKEQIDKAYEHYNRIRTTWWALLEKKIEGHKREIAIDPDEPSNYLEIGESYHYLEKHIISEDWYDQYYARDPNASPDEIIRYTNVINENKHYSKSERILKVYTERHPDDWRLWSRLGWVSNWLGKYKQAEEAFLKALAIKPYFKESEEGLEVARRETYIVQMVETDDDRNKKIKEYPIDRLTRVVRRNPKDYNSRFQLVDLLIENNRLFEAREHLVVLGKQRPNDKRYLTKWEFISNYYKKQAEDRISRAEKLLSKDPYDKQGTLIMAQLYESEGNNEEALNLLDLYFEERPDETDVPLLYTYARLLAWYKDFVSAIGLMDRVIEQRPDNIDYLLFRAQLSVWNTQDYDIARDYLERVIEKKPNNVSVLLTFSSLEMHENDFDKAKEYLDRAKAIAPDNIDVINHESNLEFRKLRYEEERIYGVLEEGRKLAIDERYDEALPYYEEFLAEAEPNKLITKEYGVINFRAEYYDKALEVYDELLSQEYDPEVGIERGQVYFALEDPENAIGDFQRAVNYSPDDFNKRIFLADAYTKAEMFSQAEAHLDTLETNFTPDSTQAAMIKQRRGWIPARGVSAILFKFPSHVRLGPVAAFYTDDLNFQMVKFGSMIELGVTDWLAVGVSMYRTTLRSDQQGRRDFNTFKGSAFIRINKDLSAGGSYGVINSQGLDAMTEIDAFIRLVKGKRYAISGSYIKSDAGINLYSPNLVEIRRNASIWRVDGFYKHRAGIKVEGYFQYINAEYVGTNVYGLSDPLSYGDNEGNQLQLRIGRRFIDYLEAGYEYFYSNFRYDSQFYYSPQGFESHSIWGEVEIDRDEDYEIFGGGKLGYVPASDFLVREAYIKGKYTVYQYLIINGRLGYGSSYREDSSYNSVSGEISASWMIY